MIVSIDRHAGAGWEDWSDYVYPVTDVAPESQARTGAGPASVRFVDPPATPLKNWGLRITDGAVVAFEGLIDGVKHSDEDQPGSPVVEAVTAGDYSDLLAFDVVPRVLRSVVETDKQRLTWLIQTYDTHGVTCGAEVQEIIGTMPAGANGLPEQLFGPGTLADAVAAVTKLTGGQVYVDYAKRAHHFIDETIAAPFNLSDDANGTTTHEYFDFTLDDDNVTKVDEVVVFGAALPEGGGLLTVTRTAPDAPSAEFRRCAPLVDEKLTSVAQCEAAGDAFLQVHRGRRSGTLKTIYPGLLGGQTVQITHAAHGLAAEPFRIHSVKPSIDGPDSAVYAVAFGDAPPSQVDIIAGTGGLASQTAAATATAIEAARNVTDLSVGGANLVVNSNFASALGTTWVDGANWVFGYAPVSPEVAMSGSKTARAILVAQTAGELVTRSVPIYRLDDYWMSVWTFMRARTSGTLRIELREYNAADALLASTVIADVAAVETDYTAHRIHMGPNSELGRTGYNAATVAVRLAVYTTGAATLSVDVGGVQIERGALPTAYAPVPSELADGSVDGGTKLIARSIVAGMIATGTLTADLFAATLAFVSKLIAGTPGANRLELDPDGLRLYSATNALLVDFTTLTANAYFSGDIQATSLTLVGAGEVRGALGLTKNSVLTLQAGQQPPTSPPVLTQGLPTPLALAATAGWGANANGGGYYDAVGGSGGATPCFVTVQSKDDGTAWRVAEFKTSDGSLDRSTTITGLPANYTLTGGLVRIGTNWYATVMGAMFDYFLYPIARATGAVGTALNITARFYDVLWNGLATDGTYLYQEGPATSYTTARVCKFSVGPLAYSSTVALTLPTAPAGSMYSGGPASWVRADIGDGNGACYFGLVAWSGIDGVNHSSGICQWTASTGALVANTAWPSSLGVDDPATGLIWDGTVFRELTADFTHLQSFTNWTWTTASALYWVRPAWVDDVGTAHETAAGAVASITMLRRRQLTITTSTIPVGGADDPNKVSGYMVNGATDPGLTHYHRQFTDALTVRTLTTYDAAGAADGGGTGFPGGVGAQLTTPGGGWNIRGNDTGSIPLAVAVAAVQLAYVEKTSNSTVTATTEGTAQTILDTGTIAYPACNAEIVFECSIANVSSTGIVTRITLFDGATVLGTIGGWGGAANYIPIRVAIRVAIAAGNHNFILKGSHTIGTGTATYYADVGGAGKYSPMHCRVMAS